MRYQLCSTNVFKLKDGDNEIDPSTAVASNWTPSGNRGETAAETVQGMTVTKHLVS